jgi:hypothetical protein
VGLPIFYELNFPHPTILSSLSILYPNEVELINKFIIEPLCCIVTASFSITIPFIKNIKSSLLVAVKVVLPLATEDVIALKLAVVEFTKLPV